MKMVIIMTDAQEYKTVSIFYSQESGWKNKLDRR